MALNIRFARVIRISAQRLRLASLSWRPARATITSCRSASCHLAGDPWFSERPGSYLRSGCSFSWWLLRQRMPIWCPKGRLSSVLSRCSRLAGSQKPKSLRHEMQPDSIQQPAIRSSMIASPFLRPSLDRSRKRRKRSCLKASPCVCSTRRSMSTAEIRRGQTAKGQAILRYAAARQVTFAFCLRNPASLSAGVDLEGGVLRAPSTEPTSVFALTSGRVIVSRAFEEDPDRVLILVGDSFQVFYLGIVELSVESGDLIPTGKKLGTCATAERTYAVWMKLFDQDSEPFDPTMLYVERK